MRDRMVKFELTGIEAAKSDMQTVEVWFRESIVDAIWVLGKVELKGSGRAIPVTPESARAAIEFINANHGEDSESLYRIASAVTRIEDHIDSVVSDAGHIRTTAD